MAPGPEDQKYADALVALGEATKAIPAIEQDLAAVLDLFGDNKDLRRFLSDPHIREDGKGIALEQILKDKLHPVLMRFILILQEQGGLASLPDIAREFFDRASRLRKRTTGELVSAVPLSEEKVAVIEEELGRILQKSVHLHVRVSADILGGVKVRVGDWILDGTVDRYFDSVRQILQESGSGAIG